MVEETVERVARKLGYGLKEELRQVINSFNETIETETVSIDQYTSLTLTFILNSKRRSATSLFQTGSVLLQESPSILRLVRTGASIAIELQSDLVQSCMSALARVFAQADLCRSDRDRTNPHWVDGLDLDRKWITTGNEVITWLSNSLIEARVCTKCHAVVGTYKKRTCCCRLCTSEWQVRYARDDN